MKLLYLSDSLVPSTKANSVQVMKMCQAFASNGANVTLVCRKGEDSGDVFSFYGVQRTFELCRISVPNVKILGRLAFLIKGVLFAIRNRPDVIFGRELFLIAILGFTRVLGRVPLILELHVPPKNKLQFRVLKVLFGSPSFKHIVVISQALRHEYERLYGDILEGRIIVAHDGADLVDDLVPNVELADTKPMIAYVGSLYQGKGVELIIELARISPEYQFHIVGGSEREISAWKEQITSQNVVFHGFKNQNEVKSLMQGFDIMLAPYQLAVLGASGASDLSRWMSPLKIFEYMSAGKPMVASDLPVLQEVLQHRKNCLLANPKNAAQWKECLAELISRPELRAQLATNALNDLRTSYSWRSRARYIL
ncbi:MAG: hypothetical protein RL266_459 [Bacteroidota bacterium]